MGADFSVYEPKNLYTVFVLVAEGICCFVRGALVVLPSYCDYASFNFDSSVSIKVKCGGGGGGSGGGIRMGED
jgi:hypothetical protein